MTLTDLVAATRDALTVRRVFGDPYERDGATGIPVAVFRGGVGGGGGQDEQGRRGDGGGFGVLARPAGAYVVKDGSVRWHPAVDVNRAMTLASTIALVWLLSARRGRGGSGR